MLKLEPAGARARLTPPSSPLPSRPSGAPLRSTPSPSPVPPSLLPSPHLPAGPRSPQASFPTLTPSLPAPSSIPSSAPPYSPSYAAADARASLFPLPLFPFPPFLPLPLLPSQRPASHHPPPAHSHAPLYFPVPRGGTPFYRANLPCPRAELRVGRSSALALNCGPTGAPRALCLSIRTNDRQGLPLGPVHQRKEGAQAASGKSEVDGCTFEMASSSTVRSIAFTTS